MNKELNYIIDMATRSDYMIQAIRGVIEDAAADAYELGKAPDESLK